MKKEICPVCQKTYIGWSEIIFCPCGWKKTKSRHDKSSGMNKRSTTPSRRYEARSQ